MSLVYKICPAGMWREAERDKVFRGAPVDLADGFIHFSTAEQMAETAARHFRGEEDLVLVAVRAESLGDALRFEASRGGALFPHLYGALPVSAVRSVSPLPLGPDGLHRFPEIPLPFDPASQGWITALRDDFIGLVGPLWTRPESEFDVPGERRFGFVAESRHLNRNGMVHGGMILTFADHSLGLTARSVNLGNLQATAQLDTMFLDGVEDGEFVEAHCRVLRRTKSLIFMTGEIRVGERAIASATGIWKIRAPALTA